MMQRSLMKTNTNLIQIWLHDHWTPILPILKWPGIATVLNFWLDVSQLGRLCQQSFHGLGQQHMCFLLWVTDWYIKNKCINILAWLYKGSPCNKRSVLLLHSRIRCPGITSWRISGSLFLSSSFHGRGVLQGQRPELNGPVRSSAFLLLFGLGISLCQLPGLIHFDVVLFDLGIVFPFPAMIFR